MYTVLSICVRYHEGILLPKKNNSEVLVPLLTLLDNLLVVGAVREQEDLSRLLILLEPKTFGPKGSKECTTYCVCMYVQYMYIRVYKAAHVSMYSTCTYRAVCVRMYSTCTYRAVCIRMYSTCTYRATCMVSK